MRTRNNLAPLVSALPDMLKRRNLPAIRQTVDLLRHAGMTYNEIAAIAERAGIELAEFESIMFDLDEEEAAS